MLHFSLASRKSATHSPPPSEPDHPSSYLPIRLSTLLAYDVLTCMQECCGRQCQTPCYSLGKRHLLFSIHKYSYLFIAGNRVSKAQSTLGKSMLSVPRHLLLLHVPRNVTWEDSFHDSLLTKVRLHCLQLSRLPSWPFLKMEVAFAFLQSLGLPPIFTTLQRW